MTGLIAEEEVGREEERDELCCDGMKRDRVDGYRSVFTVT